MSIGLAKYYVKGILSNRQIWFWGITFAFFLLLLGAFELSQSVPNTNDAHSAVAASWFGIVALFSLSSIATSIAFTIYYASPSLAYCFKYSKLTPKSFVGALIGSSSILGVMLSALVLIATSSLFSYHFNQSLVPSNPIGAVGVAALAGVFMMTFAMLIVLIVVNYVGLRSVNLMTFIPLMLAFWLGDTQMYSNLPTAVIYASPYNAIQSLLYLGYNGRTVYAQLYNSATPVLQWPILLISMFAWISLFILIDVFLLGRLRSRQAEEARQI